MTEEDRKKWNSRYLKRQGGIEPSPILTKYWHHSSIGYALDIACGNGRNSLFLADRGFSVDAVDISTVATGRLKARNPNINVYCTDLDTWSIPANRYDLIVNIRFLGRHLFPMIQQGLKPGGVLVFESFLDGETDPYCLKQNELLHAFRSLRVIYYEEQRIEDSGRFDQTASLVAIKPRATT